MRFQKTRFTPWLCALCVSLFLSGCGGQKVQLRFPLGDGNTWIYQGSTSFSLGGEEQSMPSLAYKISCKRLGTKPNAPFALRIGEEGEKLTTLQLIDTDKGLANPLTGEIWLPHALRAGKKWFFTLEGSRMKMILRSQTTRTVPAGTFPTYLVIFVGPSGVRGSFWIDPDVGIIALTWTSKTRGAQSTTTLELSSYSLP